MVLTITLVGGHGANNAGGSSIASVDQPLNQTGNQIGSPNCTTTTMAPTNNDHNGNNSNAAHTTILTSNDLAQLMSGQTVTGMLNPDGTITLNSNQVLSSLQHLSNSHNNNDISSTTTTMAVVKNEPLINHQLASVSLASSTSSSSNIINSNSNNNNNNSSINANNNAISLSHQSASSSYQPMSIMMSHNNNIDTIANGHQDGQPIHGPCSIVSAPCDSGSSLSLSSSSSSSNNQNINTAINPNHHSISINPILTSTTIANPTEKISNIINITNSNSLQYGNSNANNIIMNGSNNNNILDACNQSMNSTQRTTTTTTKKTTGQKRLTAKQKQQLQQQQQQQQQQHLQQHSNQLETNKPSQLQPDQSISTSNHHQLIPTTNNNSNYSQAPIRDCQTTTTTNAQFNQQHQIVATVQLPNGQIGQLIAPSGGQFWSPNAINLQQLSMAVAAAMPITSTPSNSTKLAFNDNNHNNTCSTPDSQLVTSTAPCVSSAGNQSTLASSSSQMSIQGNNDVNNDDTNIVKPENNMLQAESSSQQTIELDGRTQRQANQPATVSLGPGQSWATSTGGLINLSQLSALAQHGVVQMAPCLPPSVDSNSSNNSLANSSNNNQPQQQQQQQRIVEIIPQTAIQTFLSQTGQPIQAITLSNGCQSFIAQDPNDPSKWNLLQPTTQYASQTAPTMLQMGHQASTQSQAAPSSNANLTSCPTTSSTGPSHQQANFMNNSVPPGSVSINNNNNGDLRGMNMMETPLNGQHDTRISSFPQFNTNVVDNNINNDPNIINSDNKSFITTSSNPQTRMINNNNNNNPCNSADSNNETTSHKTTTILDTAIQTSLQPQSNQEDTKSQQEPMMKLKRLACTCPNCIDGENSRNVGDKKKQHVCHFPECNKVYGKTSHLRAHLRWHSGERPYVCNWSFCGKKFTRSDELQRHRRTHTGEKRFECTECLKRFMRSDHLSKHIKTHVTSSTTPVTNNQKQVDNL